MAERRRSRISSQVRIDGNNPNWEKDLVDWPTAGAIREALAQVPDEAYVKIKTHGWFWPRWNWSLWAWWRAGGEKPVSALEQRAQHALDLDRSLGNG